MRKGNLMDRRKNYDECMKKSDEFIRMVREILTSDMNLEEFMDRMLKAGWKEKEHE